MAYEIMIAAEAALSKSRVEFQLCCRGVQDGGGDAVTVLRFR